MNFYSKLFCWLLLPLTLISILTSSNILAVELQALYFGACKREVGVILDVKKHSIYLLSIDGKIKKIPRYDLTTIATYPVDTIPMNKINFDLGKGKNGLLIYKIKTKHRKEIVDLIEGWPVQFSKDKISFLSLSGREIAINRDSIWELSHSPTPKHYKFKKKISLKYQLVHPVIFDKCNSYFRGDKDKNSRATRAIRVAPQEFISDPIKLKRNLDIIAGEHEKIRVYNRSQDFYAVPQVYSNQSTLGFWGAINSRYGASQNRNNNGAPILINEFSSGPFGYQHIFYTGSAPNNLFIHEEPQTQIFYRFKADYFHLAAFLDPSLVLLGSKYNWQTNEIAVNDDRLVESSLIEFGFDYKNFSISFVTTSNIKLGVKTNSEFNRYKLSFPRLGLSYQNHLSKVELFGSHHSEKDYNETNEYTLSFYRVNAEFLVWEHYQLLYSLIRRKFKFNRYTSVSLTNALYLKYQFSHKVMTNTFLGFEYHRAEQLKKKYYLKLGLNVSLIF